MGDLAARSASLLDVFETWADALAARHEALAERALVKARALAPDNPNRAQLEIRGVTHLDEARRFDAQREITRSRAERLRAP